jgi:hypothetical protein
MVTFFTLVLAAGAGAIAFRIRGGLLSDRWKISGQLQRGVYAAIMAAVMLAAGWPWPVAGWRLALLGCAFLAAWFLGAVAFGTFGAIDAGRVEGNAVRDGFLNALRGVLYALPAAAALAGFRASLGDTHGAWMAAVMLAAGACQGLAYEAAWRIRPRHERRPTELAEFLTGACLGAGAAAACLLGNAASQPYLTGNAL